MSEREFEKEKSQRIWKRGTEEWGGGVVSTRPWMGLGKALIEGSKERKSGFQ